MTSTPTDPKKTGKLPLVGKFLDASRNSGPALPDPEHSMRLTPRPMRNSRHGAPSAGAKSSFIVASQRVSSLL